MSEIKHDYDFYAYINGDWQKLNDDNEVIATMVKYPIKVSQNNIENITQLIDTYLNVYQILEDLTSKTPEEIIEELENIEEYENISVYTNSLDETINNEALSLLENISENISDLNATLNNNIIDYDLIEETKTLIIKLSSFEDGDFYIYNNLDIVLGDYLEDINNQLRNRYTKEESNTLLDSKANNIDTYLKNDLNTYLNNLNLSNNFPNTDVLTLPSDKTQWAWFFNAILTELRDKVTNDDLEELLSVSERRYYANTKSNLPETGDSSVLYFVLTDSTSNTNQYEEYVWVNDHYELLGTGNGGVEISNYYNKNEIDEMIGNLQDYLNS